MRVSVRRTALIIGCTALLPWRGLGEEPRAEGTQRVRLPAVQGAWYPAAADELRTTIDELLARQPARKAPGTVRALIAPHAGLRYSGEVAAQAFCQVDPGIERVIILAPAHKVSMRGGGSILDVDAYRNALGDVPVAAAAAELRDGHRFFGSFSKAHAQEWSLEIMLPFLQRRLRSFALVPIVLGHGFNPAALARALAPYVDDPGTLVVASSDLSHDKPYAEAVKQDRGCTDAILAKDVRTVAGRELCGKGPVSVLLELAKMKHWLPTLIDYRNSGDTTGDKNARIVGYACITFSALGTGDAASATAPEPRPDFEGDRFSVGERLLLVDLARRSIVAALQDEELPRPPMYSDTLTRQLGCFVTLHKKGQLRGCIGHIFPVNPLVQAVQVNALSAAFKDSRFPKVTAAELADISVEVSVLTAPEALEYSDAADLLTKLRPGVHGVVIADRQGRRATYLPQVWDQIDDPVVFLSRLCLKGGLPSGAWRDPAAVAIQTYEATAFGDDEVEHH